MRHSTRSLAPSDPAHLHRKRSVLDIPFDLVSYEDVLNLIERWRQTGIKQYVVLTPPHSVLLCRRDAALRAATCRAGLILPDGVGIILAAHILNYPHHGRVTGPALMLKLCDWGRRHHYRHYFYGGAEGVADVLADRLSRQFPGLHVSGTCCPPFRSLSLEEDQGIVERINAAEPDVVWVGLGSPKQEKWMHEHLGRIHATVLVGVGAAFDFHSGRKRWAPAPIRALGLEWAYRFALEPRRLLPRCIAPLFVFGVLRQRLSKRTRPGPLPAHLSHPARETPFDGPHPDPSASLPGVFSVDVEEWFHILRSRSAPKPEDWSLLESRSDANVNRLLEMLHDHGVRATFFWLGWMAQQHPLLLKRCVEAGHEIASHGYHHVLPREVGPAGFKEDIERARKILEDATGRPVHGFRTAGFGVYGKTEWAFEIIKEVGYAYDSSVFPAYHNRRSIHYWQTGPYRIPTRAGPLIEVPLSPVSVLGCKLFLFGGGYLRLAPHRLIRWGIRQLHEAAAPLIVYVHPRELDPGQPRLPLPALRRFRCYVNLDSTVPKLAWLCRNCTFVPMREMAGELLDRGPAAGDPRSVGVAPNCPHDPRPQTIRG